eukprot:TRINITY_DN2319_c0_g3_i4.p1 TRINITY_DN2319_c0_g3~~TRINITY_DN2319_c0_g3_i4.p1  ORF type:complete len:194 (+),score=69.36 TRINITY_DN2319_c0_g3_i4:136-717(+)
MDKLVLPFTIAIVGAVEIFLNPSSSLSNSSSSPSSSFPSSSSPSSSSPSSSSPSSSSTSSPSSSSPSSTIAAATALRGGASTTPTTTTTSPSSIGDTMQIFIQPVTGARFQMTVKRSDTIADLKQQIQDNQGIPSLYHRFIFGGKKLEDERTLADCGIQQDSTVFFLLYFEHYSRRSEAPNQESTAAPPDTTN